MEESVASDRTGAARWLTIHDDLLRGMTHALSNRTGTILAVISLLEAGQTGAVKPIEMLRAEADRLETLLQTLRHLPRRHEQSLEPILPGDAARAAIELHAHHPDGRDIACDIVFDGDVVPAWGDAVALELAICAALTAAKRHVDASGRVTLRIRSTDDLVRFELGAIGTDDDMQAALALDAAAADWLIHAGGGHARATTMSIVIEVPTLAAARRARKR